MSPRLHPHTLSSYFLKFRSSLVSPMTVAHAKCPCAAREVEQIPHPVTIIDQPHTDVFQPHATLVKRAQRYGVGLEDGASSGWGAGSSTPSKVTLIWLRNCL